jgi:hypothetical protein
MLLASVVVEVTSRGREGELQSLVCSDEGVCDASYFYSPRMGRGTIGGGRKDRSSSSIMFRLNLGGRGSASLLVLLLSRREASLVKSSPGCNHAYDSQKILVAGWLSQAMSVGSLGLRCTPLKSCSARRIGDGGLGLGRSLIRSPGRGSSMPGPTYVVACDVGA